MVAIFDFCFDLDFCHGNYQEVLKTWREGSSGYGYQYINFTHNLEQVTSRLKIAKEKVLM